MSAEDNPRHPLDGIFEGLAESIAREDAEELLQEARDIGRDTREVAEKLRKSARDAIKKLEQKKLEVAREAYRAHSQIKPKSSNRIAVTPEKRKLQLFALLERRPDLGQAVTAQHRNFEDISDEDISSALEDLAELGFLDESPEIPHEE